MTNLSLICFLMFWRSRFLKTNSLNRDLPGIFNPRRCNDKKDNVMTNLSLICSLMFWRSRFLKTNGLNRDLPGHFIPRRCDDKQGFSIPGGAMI
ncbi:hypothetical protein [Spirulina sp. 06S082]|uniref:hypothetical protein n=1 Tax=Spirulina sp. 06S082 TaxID=3110248 RepID=UPI002B1EECCF|nr:hypothetical protein [Spirulina sp. 06S082]MEA5470276.1 hypothetical protein [Spirulina sp. 06S082]